ncbi:MAG: DUF4159 domain-containing protein [candidate division KSB1 bacterium]|nr:DUF4159 domain-containing protein [candidate division KSB1 bacterium]MDZ7364446.1 DUF4159 domain-containing protein [candidate division KSB1 bacterium]MDZ7402818.1 DUF4159 domain-containing protein [candidate division KSB1 bacterium]
MSLKIKKSIFPCAICFVGALLALSKISMAQPPAAPASNGAAPPAQAFTFVRVQWEGGRYGYGFSGRGGGPLWAHDYPTAEQNFYTALSALTSLPLTHENKIVTLQDDEIFDFPFLYICEVGYWTINEKEVERLSEYLARGGFLIVDDFRGGYEWNNFFDQIKKATPHVPQPITLEHPIFHCFFDFDRLGDHAPYGGLMPRYYAIFDDKGRMMAIINHNNDIGDGWEWPETDEVFSTEAFKLGINYLIYAMTH